MPVFFYIDPEFATDPRVKNINHLTLSYTFFNVEEEEVEVDGESMATAALVGRQPAAAYQH
jgi:cytochrome c oxidase assembly protein subunit 11